ncbi:hypothetical protein DH2020_041765 [Rehmannia glutinosa]|uniref:Reverse transcriptase Ty1/copia-type domain-containing protein n=1 Tax=Rehmannia glutinosa TaxID=99300 RepID=A0ABR0UQB2_REHGL
MPKSDTPRELYSIKLQRSLYGLKQSGRMWYHRLNEYLSKEGYKNDTICPCVFIKRSDTGFAIIAVYVDDMNLIGTPEELFNAAEYLKKEFEVKDLGKTKLYLGLQIKQCQEGIYISQSKYTKELLKKFGIEEGRTVSTPMATNVKIDKDEKGKSVDESKYRGMIGSLLYLTASRPDILHVVCICARFQSNPKESHMSAVKRIFRYLKGTIQYGLFYPKNENFSLKCYSDSDYAGNIDDRKSTSDHVNF